MVIDLRGSNMPISDALREHVERRLDFTLRRFGSRVGRIVVRLVNLNGPSGGPDKRCRIVAHLAPSGSVIAEATDADAYAAASQAAIRLDERVARALLKRRRRPLRTRRGTGRARLRRYRLASSAVSREPS